MNKVLTVIVPAYNMEACLPKCLGSLIIDDKDLFQKLEVIVVNDGSKDRTSEIAHEFERVYPEVFRVIDKENGHYGSCINAALPVATGVFTKVLDADDWFDTSAFKELLQTISCVALNSKCEIDVVFTNAERVNTEGRTGRYSTWFSEKRDELSLADLSSKEIANLWMHQVSYRTSMLIDMGYRQSEGIPFTDQEWMFSPMSCVRKVLFLPITVYQYLIGREGQTVDEGYYTRNFKVIRQLTLKHIGEFSRCESFATKGGMYYLCERLMSRISLVYNRHLFVAREDLADEMPDFLRFDAIVRERLPELAERIGKVRLLRSVPIGLVDAWRRKQAGRPLCYWFLMDVCIPLARFKVKMQKLFKRH